jgi:hypothetical protein
MRNERAFWQTARPAGDHAQNRAQRFVTTGLDPVVHAELQFSMDCRVKSGNDAL